jgi:Flp pilus assembly pilin Flp
MNKDKNNKGQSAAEYAILIAMVFAVCVTGVAALGTSISTALKPLASLGPNSQTLGMSTPPIKPKGAPTPVQVKIAQ